MKIDPYKHKESFENWISSISGKSQVCGLNEINSTLLIRFISDFRIGINVSSKSKKGERSFTRLNHLKQKLSFIIGKLEERGVCDVRKVTPLDLHSLFSDMRSGAVQTRFGTPYKSTGDYVKMFKTFWHWYQKTQRAQNNTVQDITEDLDTRGEKPKFVSSISTIQPNIYELKYGTL